MAGNIVDLGDGKFRLRVSIGSGKLRKDFSKNTTYEGSYEEGKIPKQVEKELALFVAAVEQNKVSISNMTFQQFTKNVWLPDYAERKLKIKTLSRYKEMLDSRIYDAIGHIKLSKLGPSHLNKFYKQLEDPIVKTSKTGELKKEYLSSRSIEHHHDLISSILGKAVKWEYIVSNPAQKSDPPKVEESERPFLEESQVKQVMTALAKEKLKYQAMILLDIFSGLRRGELMGLEWTDIDFINNAIIINKTSNYTVETGIYEDTVKTKKSNRTISMPPFVMKILREYYSEQKKYKNKKREKGKLLVENDKLFMQHNGKPMHPDTPTKWWPIFLKRNNLPHVNFHGLRHTNASIMTALGFDTVTGSGRLGHARKETFLNIYSHMLTSKEKGVAAAMEREFNPNIKHKKVYRVKKF